MGAHFIDLMYKYPKTANRLKERFTPSESDKQIARKFGKEFFDGSGIKTLKEFEKQYRGTSIKVNDSGVEDGKDEDDYSDLPDFGFDNQYAQIMNKK